MKFRPGQNLVRLAAVFVALPLLAFVWPLAAWALPVLVLLAGMLAVIDYRMLRTAFRGISISRELPNVVGRDVSFPVVLRVENSGSAAVDGEIRDVVPPESQPGFWSDRVTAAANGGLGEAAQEFRIPVRGHHEFGPAWLRLHGPCGLLDAQQSAATTGAVKVYPESFVSKQEFAKDKMSEMQLLDKLTQTRQQGAGTELESLSEFRTGDDPRRIDWRTSARQRRLIVRRYQIERHRDLMILMDCGRLMGTDAEKGTKLDCAVDAALRLCQVALEGGDRCGLGLFDDQVLGYLPPLSGVRSLRAMTESVYDVQSRWRESDFSQIFATLQLRHPKRALVVVLSDIVDEQTTRRFRGSLAMLARRHVVFFAALRTPLLRNLTKTPIESMLDGSRTAVAFRILREREKAIHSLRRSGVHVLDVEPAELTVPLINEFIELRQRNLL